MKRVTDTSREAFRRVRQTVTERDALVLAGLEAYREAHGAAPTGYELLRHLQRDHPRFDVNSVRPVLTRLEDAGLVRKADRRVCSVTGFHAYTWMRTARLLVEPAPVVERPSHQDTLFPLWRRA